MNALDWLLILLLAYSVIRAVVRGFFQEAFDLWVSFRLLVLPKPGGRAQRVNHIDIDRGTCGIFIDSCGDNDRRKCSRQAFAPYRVGNWAGFP
jgi:hypothetical protein